MSPGIRFKPGRKPDALKKAVSWLGELLSDGEWQYQTDIEAQAVDEEISAGTLKGLRNL